MGTETTQAIEQIWPAFPLHEGLFFHAVFDDGGDDPVAGLTWFHLEGPVDSGRLRAACRSLVRRHQTLRTGFHQVRDGRTVQVVRREVEVPWRETDLGPLAGTERDRELERLLADERAHRFTLTEPPLLGFHLVRTGERDGVPQARFTFTYHHLVLDGWSMQLLLDELGRHYDAGGDAGLPAAPSIEPYVAWLNDRDRESSVRRWVDALAGLTRPTLVGREVAQVAAAPRSRSAPLHVDVDGAARRNGTTVGTLLQAAWALVLSAHTARADVVFGTVVSGRPPDVPGVESLVGLFVNTVPVRVALRPDEPVRDLFTRLQADAADLAEHHHVGLHEIQAAAGLGTLFDTAVVYENFPLSGDSGGPEGSAAEGDTFLVTAADTSDISQHALDMVVLPASGDTPARLHLMYRDDVVDDETAGRVLDRFALVLGQLAGHEATTVGRVALLTDDESAVIDRTNDTGAAIERTSPVGLVHDHLRECPDALAVVDGPRRVTRQELEHAAHRLAHLLRENGVGVDDRVAIVLPRGADAVIATLAVAVAGAAYVPVDPDYPPARVAMILDDADPATVLTSRAMLAAVEPLAGRRTVVLDEPGTAADLERRPSTVEQAAARPDALAYVVYTSGSTGRPKGVATTRLGAAEYVAWAVRTYPGLAGPVLFHSPLTFDLTVTSLWGTLAAGGRIHIGDLREPDDLVDAGFTFVKGTPSHLELIDAVPGLLAPDADVVLGGEQLYGRSLEGLRQTVPDAAVTVEYGPTEITVAGVASATPAKQTLQDGIVPVGLPVSNTAVLLLSELMAPVPPGVVGEIYAAGTGLARGYLGRPGQTSERYVARPFGGSDGERVYRTGDLAYRDPDGTLVFVGRADHQIKIRGHRVEPDEIEAVLSAAPGVARAVAHVVSGPRDTPTVIGYVAPSTADTDAVQRYLADRLPEFMLPSALVTLDEFPRSPNDKVDRAALPVPDREEAPWRAPATATERTLATLFGELLGVEPVGRDADLFALGGDSIVSIKLCGRARQHGLRIRPRDVFTHRTVRALAAAADAVGDGAGPAHDRDGAGPVPPTPIMHALLGDARREKLERFEQSAVLQTPAGITEEELAACLQAVVDHHDMLRARVVEDPATGWALRIGPPGEVLAAGQLRRVPGPARPGPLDEQYARNIALLDPAGGRMAALTWFDAGPDEPGRLLWTVHHLVVDGVSWRILAEDLARAHRARRSGVDPGLPAVTTSFGRWSRRLGAEAARPERTAEAAHWRSVLDGVDDSWIAELAPGHRPVADGIVRVELDEPVAREVLGAVPASVHGTVDDVLLAALGVAVATLRGPRGTRIAVELESHGRDEFADDIDLSRTVGWFTSAYPVLVDVGDTDRAALRRPGGARALLARVKEQLRSAGDRGLGFGLLRHLADAEVRERLNGPMPRITFNYLGRFDGADAGRGPRGDGAGDWTLLPDTFLADVADTPGGPEAGDGDRASGAAEPASGAGERRHAVDVLCTTVDGERGPRLVADWRYDGRRIDGSAVRRLATTWADVVADLVAGSAGAEGGGHTPSDVGLVAMDQDELDRFEAMVREQE